MQVGSKSVRILAAATIGVASCTASKHYFNAQERMLRQETPYVAPLDNNPNPPERVSPIPMPTTPGFDATKRPKVLMV